MRCKTCGLEFDKAQRDAEVADSLSKSKFGEVLVLGNIETDLCSKCSNDDFEIALYRLLIGA